MQAERRELLDVMSDLCHGLVRHGNFPGAQPVTFQHEHVNVVKKKGNYVVCEKSDGNRYLLLFMRRSTYLVSTRMEFYRVEPPLPINLENVFGTLLDGELVIDVLDKNEPARTETNFYIFDAISIRRTYIGNLTLMDRLRVTVGEVLRHIQPTNGPVPMHLKLKKMYDAVDSRYVWENIVQAGKLTHESDGLIYTKNEAPYFAGSAKHGEILKWKPLHLNSVDWGIGSIPARDENGQLQKYYCKLFWGRQGACEAFNSSCIFLDETTQNLLREISRDSGQDIVIGECFWDSNWYDLDPPQPNRPWSEKSLINGGGWRFMRLRSDKSVPNNFRTVQSVMESIRNPLEAEDLFSA